MSRTATAETPNETYDQLSLDERDTHDRIAALGITPVPSGRGWIGERGEERFGPFPTLEELENCVVENTTAEDGDGFKLTGDSPEQPTGKTVKVRQPLLPNTENMVLQNLREAILSYRATTMDILSLQDRQKDEKRLVMALMHKFEDELSTDKETGNKYYQVETIRAVLEITEKEDLKTEKVDLP